MVGLSLEMGVPLSALSLMSERHLRMYETYGHEMGFPNRRLELYLAQLAALVATIMGGAKDVTLKDFMFDPRTVEPVIEDVEELKLAIGFSPRNKA